MICSWIDIFPQRIYHHLLRKQHKVFILLMKPIPAYRRSLYFYTDGATPEGPLLHHPYRWLSVHLSQHPGDILPDVSSDWLPPSLCFLSRMVKIHFFISSASFSSSLRYSKRRNFEFGYLFVCPDHFSHSLKIPVFLLFFTAQIIFFII